MMKSKGWGSSTPRENAKVPSPGFSLVELIYVMLILGILAGMAIPLLDVDKFRLNAGVNSLASELMAAQRGAVLKGHNVVVAMDQAGNRLRVHNDANNDGIIQSSEFWKVVQLGEGVTFGLSGGPKLSEAEAPFAFLKKQGTYPAVTFHRNGSASERGILYLTGIGGGARAENDRALEIIRSTAKVKCWSYRTGTWQEAC